MSPRRVQWRGLSKPTSRDVQGTGIVVSDVCLRIGAGLFFFFSGAHVGWFARKLKGKQPLFCSHTEDTPVSEQHLNCRRDGTGRTHQSAVREMRVARKTPLSVRNTINSEPGSYDVCVHMFLLAGVRVFVCVYAWAFVLVRLHVVCVCVCVWVCVFEGALVSKSTKPLNTIWEIPPMVGLVTLRLRGHLYPARCICCFLFVH